MRTRLFAIAFAVVAALIAAAPAQADSILDFEDGTDQGFGTGFGNDASISWPIESRGGSLRMRLALGGFQTAGRETSNPIDPVYIDLTQVSGNEAIWRWSYDWYIDTSELPVGQAGTFFQIGTYFNTGNGYYAQDFPGAGKDVELGQAQLESGQVFSGTVDETFAAKGYAVPAGQTFFRPGFITNGTSGSAQFVHIDNIRFYVPEPGSVVLMALAVPALALVVRRRRK